MFYKSIIKKIKRFFCPHIKQHYVLQAKPKYKQIGKRMLPNLRYDIYQLRLCETCGKPLQRIKLKSNLKEDSAKRYISNHNT